MLDFFILNFGFLILDVWREAAVGYGGRGGERKRAEFPSPRMGRNNLGRG